MNKYRLLLSKIYRFFFPISLVEMYRRMGVQIGEHCKFQSEVLIDYSHYWLITIGNNVTLAPRVHILAHDASTKSALGYTKIGLTSIEDDVFIGAGTIVLPGVIIGKYSIVGAGAVVTHSIPAGVVAVGNPAKVISSIEEYYNKIQSKMNTENCFGEDYTLRNNLSQEKKQEMIDTIKKYGCAFVE